MDAEAVKRAGAKRRATASRRSVSDVGVEALLARIAGEYDALPRQLASIARYVEQHRRSVMVDRVGEIASRCGVPPSAVVRFAQRMGYPGFTAMQAVFRAEYAERASPVASYDERIRKLAQSRSPGMSGAAVARAFIEANQSGLEELARDFDAEAFEAAVTLLARAAHIYVVGVRRSYAVAAYITYALQHVDKRVQLVDGIGGMFHEQGRSAGRGDVVIAISFTPYGKETLAFVRGAVERGAKALVLTDSRLSPLARHASAMLVVREGSAFAFRSLGSTLCLCQALFVALAYRLSHRIEETRHRGEYDD
jgi:DNA-binding MurR/RpiR family transcriptional regulator